MLSRYNVHNPLLPVWGIPASSGSSLHSMMNRLFADLETVFDHDRSVAAPRARRASGPRVQLRDVGDAVAMQADLPGYRMQDIELSIEDTTVTLKASAPAADVPEGFTLIRRERERAGVDWSFELPYPIDSAAASATLTQGRLYVTLPKAPEAKPRNIPVKAA
jgi:HSP20 family protein